jgi:hypothetical protein
MTTIETTPELAADPIALAYAEGMAAFNSHFETKGDHRLEHCPYQPGTNEAGWFMAGWSDAYTRRRTGNLQRLNAITTGRLTE